MPTSNVARANNVPAIAMSGGTPADTKNAIIIVSYTPAPPGEGEKILIIEAMPNAINNVAGLTQKPNDTNAIKINETSNKLVIIDQTSGRTSIFFS